MANEKISWRNGNKVIIHLTDAGAHGKLFTKSDIYPDEEQKLVLELEKCALKNIKIFGYIINEDCRNSFDECSKIYRSKGGSFEIFDFISPEMKNMNMMNPMMKMPYEGGKIVMNSMMNAPNPMIGMGMGMNYNMNMNMMNSSPMMMGMNSMNMMNAPNPMMGMGMGMNHMNMMNSNPLMNMSKQEIINSNFRMNSIKSISNSIGGLKKD